MATVTTAGESESDSDDSDSDTDSKSNVDDFDNNVAAVTGDTPSTFDDEPPEPEDEDDDVVKEEDEVEAIPNALHQSIRAQPARAAKQGVTYSTINVKQHPVHDDCDPRVVGKCIHTMNHSFVQTYSLKAGLSKFKD